MPAKDQSQKTKEIKALRKARKFALQAIYQWQASGCTDSCAQLEVQFKTANTYHKHVSWELFVTLVQGVLDHYNELDKLFVDFLPATLAQVNPVERAALRLGCFELKFHQKRTPYKVVISEYVGLIAEFGAKDGEKFVNGVLDKVAHKLL